MNVNEAEKPRSSSFGSALSYRPPTPPRTFRDGSNLWRAERIPLAKLSDSDTPTKNTDDATKASESDVHPESDPPFDSSRHPKTKSKSKKSHQGTQVDSTSLQYGGKLLAASKSYYLSNYHDNLTNNCSETSDTSLSLHLSPTVDVGKQEFNLPRASKITSPKDEVIIWEKPDRIIMRSNAEQAERRRYAVSKSLVLENSCHFACASPLPSDWSSTSGKKHLRHKNHYADCVHRSRRREDCYHVLDRRYSDTSSGSTDTGSHRSVKRRSRPPSRSHRTKRYSGSPRMDMCASCADVLAYHQRYPSCKSTPAYPDDVGSLQRIHQLEREKKDLMLQVSVLTDQIDAQGHKIHELESNLEEKKIQLRRIEQNLQQEMMARSEVENRKLELMTELSNLRLRLTAAERDKRESDDRCRKMEGDFMSFSGRAGDSDAEQAVLRARMIQNGTLLTVDKSPEVEKLCLTLESIMAANEEKDKKIDELRMALVKYKKLQEYVFSGHAQKGFDIKDAPLCEGDDFTDILSPPSPVGDCQKYRSQSSNKFQSKPLSPNRVHLSSPVTLTCDTSTAVKERAVSLQCSQSSLNSAGSPCTTNQPFHKSNSLENVIKTSSLTSSLKNAYGTIPRQSGPQSLQHLHDQLHNMDDSSRPKFTNVNAVGDASHSNSNMSTSSPNRHRRAADQGVHITRNKSSGVSFGKGFFKLRSGKRSSSAPELAPQDSVTIVAIERDTASTSPTPQPNMQHFLVKPDRNRSKGLLRFLTKWKRSGSQNIDCGDGDFRRGGIRATAGPRLGWSRDISINLDIPFPRWTTDILVDWLNKIGLNMYIGECRRWRCNGEQLLNATSQELERELNIRNPLHKKKLILALEGMKSETLPPSINSMDYHWVIRWLDDVGLPQYKDPFSEARVDGRMLHFLTVDDLLFLKVTNELHHISIKRGIQVLREKNFDPHCLIRRSVPDEDRNYTPELVSLWTNHRVMEWLRTVDLSEYAPNLRGSGVHGALIVYEPKFNTDLVATLLNIPPTKTLLRRHLATHFKAIVGSDQAQAKREVELDQLYVPLTPNIKVKGIRKAQFSLRKKKGKEGESEYICPMDIPVGAEAPRPNTAKLVVRRNSDPAPHDRSLDSQDEKTAEDIGAVSKEISTLTDMLQDEKLLKSAPTTNV